MRKTSVIFLLMLLMGAVVYSQGIETIYLDADVHNTVAPVGSDGTRIVGSPEGVDGYAAGVDYWYTITGSCEAPKYAFSFTFENVNLRFQSDGTPLADTIFVYDGVGINSPLLWYATGEEISPLTFTVFASPNNAAQALTVRLKSASSGSWVSGTGGGFTCLVGCKQPCESVTPYLDSIFYKTRNGEIYEFGRIKTLYDTVYTENQETGGIDIEYVPFKGVNICMGDGVIFTAHCDYTNNTGWYTPSDATSIFEWTFGTGDVWTDTGLTSVYYDDYRQMQCYDASLKVTDERGCTSTTFPQVRVRLAQNPLKTIFTLADICNNDSLYVNMGYDGDNATLTLGLNEYAKTGSKTYEVRTFIPDGPNCAVQCYIAPVTFDEFPSGRKVENADDICSICVNFEHSFMGDYSLSILCPTYQAPGYPASHGKAVLKYKDNCPAGQNCPPGTTGGGGRFTGIPYDGGAEDNTSNPCDSLLNPFGIGWNYCFSRNEDYTLISGQPANVPNPNNAGMTNGPMVNVSVTMPPIPAGFAMAGQTKQLSVSTLDSSDYHNKLKYYTTADNFSTLAGCPLNGQWSIEVCDNWNIDNGWVFSWTLDICNVKPGDCEYQVPIDSIVWKPDMSPQYCDYDLGHYRGVEVHPKTPYESYICTPDTAGRFKLDISIFDNFGCVWDTNTFITSYWSPAPNLGDDITLCGVSTVELDATDRHTDSQNYSYLWEPYGQVDPVIVTQDNPNGDVRYVVEVTNSRGQAGSVVKCVTRDTIDVLLRRQPMPSFIPTPFLFEGCDPFTVSFENQTSDGDYHFWDFGDGITSTLRSPTHTYAAGTYDLKYYATSSDGCVDSVVLENAVKVFPSPQADFSWSPTFPPASNPVVNFDNRTRPLTGNYFWEIQYDRDNPVSVHTMTQTSPIVNFNTFTTPDELPGNYLVRLIARTDNIAPSGNILRCADTTENSILIVNDYLQFPNVVTPNGDGVNDVFRIVGLVDGFAYPTNQLDIYNKWGALVYHKVNISSEEDFWDPSDMPAGTYFYRFTAHGYNGNIEHNGAVEVIK